MNEIMINKFLKNKSHILIALFNIFISIIFVYSIYYFPMMLLKHNYVLGTIHEEPVGYYYFYSLRTAFGNEYPWMPQSHLIIMIGTYLQHILSFIGLPETQFLPRIRHFESFFVLLPILLTFFAFLNYSFKLKNKALLCLIFTYVYYMLSSANLPSGYLWISTIAYQIWILPVVFFSLSLMPSFTTPCQKEDKSISWYTLMGVFLGIVISIKITFAVLPLLALFLTLINSNNIKLAFIKSIFSAIIASLILVLVILKITNFSGKLEFLDYISNVLNYYKSESQNSSVANLNKSLYPSYATFFIPIAYLFLLIFSIIKKNINIIIISIVSLLSSYFIILRFYSHTLIEYHANSAILIPAFFGLLEINITQQKYKKWSDFLMIIFSVVSFTLIFHFNKKLSNSGLNFFKYYGLASKEFHKKLNKGNRKVFILTTDNSFRPSTLESALCKGGTNINSPKWEDSSYIQKKFPLFYCTTGALLSEKLKQELPRSTVGFSAPEANVNNAISRIEKHFDISLNKHKCHMIQKPSSIPLVYCVPL